MIERFGRRQQQLLRLLLAQKTGLTIDQLSHQLTVSRNAVRQHLGALEADGLVTKGKTQATGGRPEQLYVLTPKGVEAFPRKYSWFSELLLESLEKENGRDALDARFRSMGNTVAAQVNASRPPANDAADRVRRLATLMQEFGYEARAVDRVGRQLPMIEATNCVFHHLASRFPEVCQFDLAFLNKVVGHPVVHEECIVRGGHVCRFKFQRTK